MCAKPHIAYPGGGGGEGWRSAKPAGRMPTCLPCHTDYHTYAGCTVCLQGMHGELLHPHRSIPQGTESSD
jgi:hypothetical protein